MTYAILLVVILVTFLLRAEATSFNILILVARLRGLKYGTCDEVLRHVFVSFEYKEGLARISDFHRIGNLLAIYEDLDLPLMFSMFVSQPMT